MWALYLFIYSIYCFCFFVLLALIDLETDDQIGGTSWLLWLIAFNYASLPCHVPRHVTGAPPILAYETPNIKTEMAVW